MKHQRSILLLAEWADPLFYQGIARYAKQASWHLNLDAVYNRHLPVNWKGDGCIPMVESKEALAYLESLNVPCPSVHWDARREGQEAADYFAGLGFRHFACYTADPSGTVSKSRVEGYVKRLDTMGYTAETLGWNDDDSATEMAWDKRRKRLGDDLTKLPKPIAVFCIDDRMALNVVEACIELGIDIPNEVAVLGVGNMELACECSAVPLSSIRIDFETVGYEAAAQLDRMLDGQQAMGAFVLPSAGIEERRSTYTLAVDDLRGRKALRFMLDHYHDPIGVEEIAKAGGLTRWQLAKITRNELHTIPLKLLEDTRIKKACELLETTHYPIKRVAYEVGLGTALRLQRIFRKRFKTTPTDWRRAVREPVGGIGHTSGE